MSTRSRRTSRPCPSPSCRSCCKAWDSPSGGMAADYLENSYLAYELEPVEDPEADWRLDVYTGTCRLPVIINDYMTARSDAVDEYHKDGIAVGFLCYPLEGFNRRGAEQRHSGLPG